MFSQAKMHGLNLKSKLTLSTFSGWLSIRNNDNQKQLVLFKQKKCIRDILLQSIGKIVPKERINHLVDILLQSFDWNASSDFSITPITSGYSLSAINFKLVINKNHFIIRLTSLEKNLQSRKNEVAIHLHLSQKKISPAVHFACANRGIIISAFIHVSPIDWTQHFSDKMAKKLALKLQLLHKSWPKKIKNRGISPSGLPHDSRQRVQTIISGKKMFYLQTFTIQSLPPLESFLNDNHLVHHDLHPGNILFDGDDFWLIDLESSGSGDLFIDLAPICHITQSCPGMEKVFLNHYFGRDLKPIEKSKLFLAKIISSLRYSISSFSNCREYTALSKENIFPICKFTDYSPDQDGKIDLETDSGKYWQSITLLKQALHYLSDKNFPQSMHLLTRHQSNFWQSVVDSQQNLMIALTISPPKNNTLQKETGTITNQLPNQINASTILALARFLRFMANVNTTLPIIKKKPKIDFYYQKSRVIAFSLSSKDNKGFFLKEILSCYNYMERLLSPFYGKAFCHYNLTPSKLLFSKSNDHEKVWTRDWNTAKIGYELFDLATITTQLGLSKQKEALLLLCYFGSRITKKDMAYYHLIKQLALLRSSISLLSSCQKETVFINQKQLALLPSCHTFFSNKRKEPSKNKKENNDIIGFILGKQAIKNIHSEPFKEALSTLDLTPAMTLSQL